MVPITQFIPQYDPVCVWQAGFTSAECEDIKKIGEIREFEKGRIGSSEDNILNPKIRKSDITWLEPSDQTRSIFERLDGILGRANFERFQLALTGFDGLQYTKYKSGGHYDWHTDIVDRPPNPELHRKLSVSVILSDPSEYEGGELLMNANGDPSKAVSLKPGKGDVVIFYSHIPHKVMPVTSGDRVVLVTWILGPKVC